MPDSPNPAPNPAPNPDRPFLERVEQLLLPVDAWGELRRGARAAAVTLILFEEGSAWHVPFVNRRPDLPSHGGQVALPGGTLKPGEAAWAAAQREAAEEVGVAEGTLRPLGAGTPIYASVSNFHVVPFVAHLAGPRPAWIHDQRELEGVFEVPLAKLLAEEHWIEAAPDQPERWIGRHFPWQDRVIWGLTARILQDLLPPIREALTAAGVPA